MELYRLGMRPDFFQKYFATSAGVFNAAYWVTGQIDEGYRIWTRYLPSGFWKWNRNDMRYLRKILKEIEPLGSLRNMDQQIFVTVCNPSTLSSESICLNNFPDPIGLMLASAAMPFLTGPCVVSGRTYYDAGLISQPPIDHIEAAESDEVWVFMSSPKGYRMSSFGWRLLGACTVHDKSVRRLLWNCPSARNQTLELIESQPHLKIIRPQVELPIGWRSADVGAIIFTIQLGRKAARQFARNEKW